MKERQDPGVVYRINGVDLPDERIPEHLRGSPEFLLSEFALSVDRTRNANLSCEMTAANWGLGLAGEVGEVIEIIKKDLFHGKDVNTVDLINEVGDVMYYLQSVANFYGFGLDQAMKANHDKLMDRYPDGFVSGGGIR